MRPILTALVVLGLAHPAAAELSLLTTGAFHPVAEAIVHQFEAAGGERVRITTATAGGALSRVKGGEAFDVVVITPGAIDQLIADGILAPGSRVDVAKVGIGIAVPSGTPAPDISTPEAVRALLLAAPHVAIVDPASGGSSGIYLIGLFDRWGIGAEMAAKLVKVQGGRAAERLATGEATVALQQVSELVGVPGAQFVGTLPPAVQSTTTYSAGLPVKAAPGARGLLAALTSAEARAAVASKGMEVP